MVTRRGSAHVAFGVTVQEPSQFSITNMLVGPMAQARPVAASVTLAHETTAHKLPDLTFWLTTSIRQLPSGLLYVAPASCGVLTLIVALPVVLSALTTPFVTFSVTRSLSLLSARM